jgi:8-hydroxy-5-deazaflavin:NADPH oxidoreductase
VARGLPGARLVKAFNTMYYRRLADEGRTGAPSGDRLAIPVAADDAEAKAVVSGLIEEIGFAAVDGGTLAESRHQQPGSPLYNNPVGPKEAAELLRGS